MVLGNTSRGPGGQPTLGRSPDRRTVPAEGIVWAKTVALWVVLMFVEGGMAEAGPRSCRTSQARLKCLVLMLPSGASAEE